MSDPTAFGYGDFRFSWGDHLCAIFEDHVQQMEVMVPFISYGLREGQRCVWVGPEISCEGFRRSLAEAGGDLPTLEASGQLVVIPDVAYYLEGGLFEPARTLALLRSLLDDSKKQGYPTMRVTGDVSWLVQHHVEPDTWELWESALNEALAGQPMVVVCQYGRRQVSGSMVVTALQTHPYVILGGDIHENPFYAPTAGALTEIA